MKKKVLSLVLVLVLLLTAIPMAAIPASAASSALSFASAEFVGYKGWLTANDGQERYKQRGNSLGLAWWIISAGRMPV